MALTKCPDCGKELSTEAVTCPHCGRPSKPVPQRWGSFEIDSSRLTSIEGQNKPKKKILGRNWRLLLAVTVIVLAWLGYSQQNRQERTSAPLTSWKERAYNDRCQNVVREKLKDPKSGEFRNVYYHYVDQVHVSCGEVNAKTGFGGYGGFQRYICAANLIILERDRSLEPGAFNGLWDQFCR